MQRSDAELVRACLSGDSTAWNVLVERYGRLVYSIPMRHGLRATDADDVVQTVFGIVFRRLETLRDLDRLAGWLIRTSYRETWRLAKRARTGERELGDELPSDGVPTDLVVEQLERQHIVHNALKKLDERCRALIESFFFDPQTPSYDELASRLEMPVGSIGPTRGRCLEKLERILIELGI